MITDFFRGDTVTLDIYLFDANNSSAAWPMSSRAPHQKFAANALDARADDIERHAEQTCPKDQGDATDGEGNHQHKEKQT